MGKEQRQESPPMLLVVALAAVFLCSCPAAVSARKVWLCMHKCIVVDLGHY